MRAFAPDREPQCLHQGFSQFNEVVTVIQIPEDPAEPSHRPLAGCRILLLDSTGNLHSVYHPTRPLTGSYWDVLAGLPSLVPAGGPLGLLGLGAGTIPRIMAAHYPMQPAAAAGGGHVVHGWELDPGVVAAARMHLGMAELEAAGHLVVHTGDALAPEAAVPGGFSGVIVDLFGGGRLLPQLTKRETWESIRCRLAPAAPGQPPPRVIANLGQSPPTTPGQAGRWQPEAYTTLRAYEALEAAFEGEVSLMTVQSNTLALTGPLPSLTEWPGRLPAPLREQLVKLNGDDGGSTASGSGGSSSGGSSSNSAGDSWRTRLEQERAGAQAGAGSGGGGLQPGHSSTCCWARDVYPLQRTEVNLSLW
ncbi:hypothetical protein HYH02_004807 [Chlamydomonas schloesseri]|uniref:PABS domain-containing protein n=1 Tax=Chlamydomonas schloesseri TaxID=2026947 RepID=A0A835WPC3_9CHLO|nr:hypothetical protein HYH02_004807 [Chlamydomonas schloesseri]|eukprot:KAG2450300.1 hypothetical protein HYH02_004807 [Chlamydomonas schloesseri]